MVKKDEDYLVKCPYYKHDTSHMVYCEGLEDGMVIHMAFATHTQLLDYKKRFCRKDCWQNCPVAKMLNQKWGCSDA